MEIEASNGLIEPKVRLTVKKNFKGEYGWEFTCRGDTVEEVRKLWKEVKREAEKAIR